MTGALFLATLLTALGCGLAAGALFAFSAFVMAALGRLPAPQGIAAMQSINVLAVTPVFMTALFGTAAGCFGLVVWAAISADGRELALVATGAGLFLIGSIGVTMAANVPLNNRLAALDPADPAAAGQWQRYLSRWTAWNHLRTAAALAAAASLTVALTA